MIRAIAVIAAVAIGCFAGYLIRLLPLGRYWQSLGALTAGWVLAGAVLASGWLLAPPSDIEVLAVSFGLREAFVSLVVMVVGGSILHSLLVGPAAALLPAMELYRAPAMGAIGAVLGAASFTLGFGGVHPMTR